MSTKPQQYRPRQIISVAVCLLAPVLLVRCSPDFTNLLIDGEVPVPDSTPGYAGSGSARVSGTVRSAEGDAAAPLADVRVELGDALAYSEEDGSFLLAGVPAGRQRLFVDGTEVQTPQGHYGQFATTLELSPDDDREIERPIYLPFVSTASEETIDPEQPTVVVSSDGITLEIAPGGVRTGADDYDGSMSLPVIAPDRTPMALPSRFDGRIDAIISIQPIGLRFPVPPTLSSPATSNPDNVPTRQYRSLWAYDSDTGAFKEVGVGRREENQVVIISGGTRNSGWHVLTHLELAVRAPCHTEPADLGRRCYAAADALLREARVVNRARVPGAPTALARYNTALEGRGRTLERAQTVLEISAERYSMARDAIEKYRALYQQSGTLSNLTPHLAVVAAACGGVDVCSGDNETLPALQDELGELLDNALVNVDDYAWRFDRLRAAVSALAPFYDATEPLILDALSDFHRVAGEFNDAYADFAPFQSPVEAYDALVESLAGLEQSALALVETVSLPADEAGTDQALIVQRICANRGTTHIENVVDGFVHFEPGDRDGQLTSDCIIVASDVQHRYSSLPIPETTFVDSLRAPAMLGLTHQATANVLELGEFEAGTLNTETPVVAWTFDPGAYQGFHVDFSPAGAVLAGLRLANGVVPLAAHGGFKWVSLSGNRPIALEVLATGMSDVDHEVWYTFSVNPDPDPYDLGMPVAGSFDLQTRAVVILFEADSEDQVFVEKRCCDFQEPEFDYELLRPDGLPVPSVGSAELTTRNRLYELDTAGMYRVVLTPLPGRFPDYEMVIQLIPPDEFGPTP